MQIAEQLKSALRDRYRIEREIGAGGMATVYLAEDVRHERHVALKVLNPELGAVLGVERFLAEIKVTAHLQHPNLLPLFDSGEANGLLFYVMPFVEGESLRARLTREKHLPIVEAVHIAVSVAGALDYAHGHGVVHRDLKPENILIQAGEPLVADFGIALAVSNAGGARITQTGISLGTPHYMSPEQATGDRAVDRRSDVYSLGAVLYEMLSGDPPHTGSTAHAIIAKVLTDKPRSVRAFRESVPEHVADAVDVALAKLPADRFATAAEFAQALAGRSVVMPTGALRASASQRPAYLRDPRTWVAVAAVVVAALALSSRWLSPRRDIVELPQLRTTILPPPGEDFTGGGDLALSPDGSMLAFTVLRSPPQPRLFVRALNADISRELPGTGEAHFPFWSPDGTQIGFFTNSELRVIGVDGHGTATIARVAHGQGGTWAPDGTMLFAGDPVGAIYRVRSGGQPVAVAKSAPARQLERPMFLPDGHHFVFSAYGGDGVFVGDLRDGSQRRVADGGDASYAGPGYLVLAAGAGGEYSTLAVVPFDPARGVVRGAPTILTDSVFNPGGVTGYSVSATGVFVFQRSPTNHVRIWMDRHGTALDSIGRDSAWTYRISHNGRFAAQGGYVASVRDLRRGIALQLSSGLSMWPVWSPDDQRLAFFSAGPTVSMRIIRADGAGEPVDMALGLQPLDWTKDGESIVASGPTSASNSAQAVWIVSTRSPAASAKLWLSVPGNVFNARLSPDGHWLAYQSDETGLPEIYVRPFPGPGAPVRVSPAGGGAPTWRGDGRELYYLTPAGDLVAVSVTLGPGARFNAGRPQLLIRALTRQPFTPVVTPYDVTPDGQRFLVYTENRAGAPPLTVLAPWQRSLPRDRR